MKLNHINLVVSNVADAIKLIVAILKSADDFTLVIMEVVTGKGLLKWLESHGQ